MIRVGLIGAGGISAEHVNGIKKSGLAEIKMVYAPDETAKKLAENCGATTVASAEALIQSPDIDAVFILSPTNSHADYLRQVHAAGKHVLCEKPVVRTAAEADEIEKLFEGYAPVAMAGMVMHFWPEYLQVRDMIKKGDIGRLGTVRMYRGAGCPTKNDKWRGDFKASGGVILDMGIHDIDFVDWALGPLTRIFTMRSKPNEKGQHDYALMVARTADGAIVHFEESWNEAPHAFYYGFEITGSGGLLELDSRIEAQLTVRPVENAGAGMKTTNPAAVSPHDAMISAFLEAVAEGKKSPVTIAEGLRAVRLALAAIESAEKNAPIEL